LAEGVLLGFAGGNILHCADHADDVGAIGGEVGVAGGGEPRLDAVGGLDAVFGAVDTSGLEKALEVFGGEGLVFEDDDTFAEGGAGNGDVRLRVEEEGGALVEVEEVSGAVPGPGAELGGVESLAESTCETSWVRLSARRRLSMATAAWEAMVETRSSAAEVKMLASGWP
jgi:hypothetical protein